MATVNVENLLKDMLQAAQGVLTNHWGKAKPFAEQEFRSFAQNIQLIGELKLKGEITEEEAKLHLRIQKSSIRVVLLTIEGLGILAVESAINAALNVVKGSVNTT